MKQIFGWLVALATAVGGGSTPASAAGMKQFKGDVLGTFAFHPCPAEAPARAQCLHDDVAGNVTHLGQTIGSFEVVFDIAAFGDDGCGPIRKHGSFVAANGEWLYIEADGTFCFNTLVAAYKYRVTGGTGRFAGATGEGHWIVPPPTTFDGVAGTGDEVLIGSIATVKRDRTTVLP